MPTYEYKCKKCENQFEKVLRISQSKESQSCPECGSGETFKIFTTCNFVLKGSFPGKDLKIDRQMAAKNRVLDKKQSILKKESPIATLVPNVGGEQVESWSEAKKLAKDKGLDTKSFDSYVKKEASNK